jgi:hypothetical protein
VFRLPTGDEAILRQAFATAAYPGALEWRRLLDTAAATPLPSEVRDAGEPLDVETLEVVEDLAGRLNARRRKARDAFADIDRPVISERGFRNALDSFSVVLRAPEIKALVRLYRVAGGLVEWERFVGDIESMRPSSKRVIK